MWIIGITNVYVYNVIVIYAKDDDLLVWRSFEIYMLKDKNFSRKLQKI